MTKRPRRNPRSNRTDRKLMADRLHLLADGEHAACSNRFSVHALHPEQFAELWTEHGESIVARWREEGHTPSDWWRWMARRAGVAVPPSNSIARAGKRPA